MVSIDSNLIIYASKGLVAADLFKGHKFAYSSIVRIETLGYGQLTLRQEAYLKVFFEQYQHCLITESVVERAIQLRASYTIGMADAIVAAVALDNNHELWTANLEDFKNIPDLKIVNPLSTQDMERITKQ